ncbi:MAG: hypothetical protein M3Q39_00430, partial [Actinomycetota bacterium]|nr:hypothetical protein [Actinomycetota bacterium]
TRPGTDTHVLPWGNYVISGWGNYVIVNPSHWGNYLIADTDACNISIVDASKQWLEYLREGSQIKHQIVASACSIDHARRIRALYEERGLQASEIHSGMSQPEQDRIHERLNSGLLDVIIQVQMLGEGFDHKPLSVAAIFRPYRSLSPYIQFVGRVMRVNRPDKVAHLDNRAVIVSHVGLNIEQHWDDFKLIDQQDQTMITDWLGSTDASPPRRSSNPTIRRPLHPHLRVEHEQILDQFLTEDFLDIPLEDLPDRVIDALRAQGIDPDTAGLDRDIIIALMEERRSARPTTPVASIVQPQARRQAQKRLRRHSSPNAPDRSPNASATQPASPSSAENSSPAAGAPETISTL